MAEKPRDAVVKFYTYRNVQLAASRGLPCDSAALVLLVITCMYQQYFVMLNDRSSRH